MPPKAPLNHVKHIAYLCSQNMAKRIIHTFLLILFIGLPACIWAQDTVTDSLIPPPTDSLIVLTTDSLVYDTAIPTKDVIDAKILYEALDSMVFDVQKQVMYLYGKSKISYKNTILDAATIDIEMKDKSLKARGTRDSLKNYVDRPYFKDGEQGFFSDSIKYNFDTEKGKIYHAKTQDGDGYIHGNEIKKIDDKVIFIRDGKYTTCQNDSPHFHIHAKKLKLIKEDKIVTGPANFRVMGAPTPVWLPFGFFPNNDQQSSGLVLPNSYGVSPNQGAFLNKIGFFWAASDYFNTEILGDIYSLGSWALYSNSNYKKKYRFQGNLNVSYYVFKQGLKELPTYQEQRNFLLQWKHQQDPKASRSWTFSSDVTAGSSSAYRNNITTTTNNYLSNVFRSNVSLGKSFRLGSTPAALAINAAHEQNVQDSSIILNIPTLNLNVTRFFPFKNPKKPGNRWYHDIGVSYTASFQNQLKSKLDSNFFTANTLGQMTNGFQHSIPISTSLKWKNFLTINPSINYKGVSYLERYEKTWSTADQKEQTDTLSMFTTFHAASANIAATTKMYGMYAFSPKSRVKAIRHVITPNVTVSYAPDMNQLLNANYFGEYTRYDTNNNPLNTIDYAKISGIYGSPTQKNTGSLNFSIINDLEMKYLAKDSLKTEKKMKLLDNFFMGSGYIFTLDSFQLQPVNFRGNFNVIKNLNINFSGIWDPYRLDPISGRRINHFEWEPWSETARIARLTTLNAAVGYSLRGGSESTAPAKSNKGSREELEEINQNRDLYVDFNVPWSLTLSYNFYYTKPQYEKRITQSVSFTGDIKITPAWKVGFSSSYDLQLKKLALPTLNIYRDLHCWEMKFQVIPSGTRQSYRFDLNARAPILQDLKLTRRLEWYDRQ